MKRFTMKALALLVIVAFTFTTFAVDQAQASIKQFLLGGAIGAGVVLAWPTICGALSACGGAIAAGVGWLSGAAAVGGAAVGGAVAGVGAAAGTAVTGAFGAIGGGIAAITASPLFIPAILIAGALLIGYLIYKKHKAGTSSSSTSLWSKIKAKLGIGTTTATAATQVTSNYTPAITSSTSYANYSSASSSAAAATPSTFSANVGSGTPAITSSNANAANTPTTIKSEEGNERKPDTGSTATVTANNALSAAHDKYVAAYKKYIDLLGSKNNASDPDVQSALKEYKDAFSSYQGMLK